MYPVRRIALLLLAGAVVAGCGSSITQVTPRTAAPTQARAVTPFCDAIDQNRKAAEPLSRGGLGSRVENIDQVADQIRSANQQVAALAPPEQKADADRIVAVLDRQLRVLVDNDGDTAALARDPEIEQATRDPEYAAANRRLSEYVRTSC
jgi:hypothetical protein